MPRPAAREAGRPPGGHGPAHCGGVNGPPRPAARGPLLRSMFPRKDPRQPAGRENRTASRETPAANGRSLPAGSLPRTLPAASPARSACSIPGAGSTRRGAFPQSRSRPPETTPGSRLLRSPKRPRGWPGPENPRRPSPAARRGPACPLAGTPPSWSRRVAASGWTRDGRSGCPTPGQRSARRPRRPPPSTCHRGSRSLP